MQYEIPAKGYTRIYSISNANNNKCFISDLTKIKNSVVALVDKTQVCFVHMIDSIANVGLLMHSKSELDTKQMVSKIDASITIQDDKITIHYNGESLVFIVKDTHIFECKIGIDQTGTFFKTNYYKISLPTSCPQPGGKRRRYRKSRKPRHPVRRNKTYRHKRN